MANGRANRSLVTPRTRGGVTGLTLMLLGAWGAVIPFVGPYFNYAYTPNSTWTWTAARGVLEVLPGVVAFLAGVVLLGSTNRVTAWLAGWLGAIAGAWFIVGPLLSPIWRAGYVGTPTGGTTRVALEQIGIFFGLGGAIILFAALAIGRFSVVGVRDVAYAERRASRATPEPELDGGEPDAATVPVTNGASATSEVAPVQEVDSGDRVGSTVDQDLAADDPGTHAAGNDRPVTP